ncbi:MAG: methane monooxygenase/ammonia monooxygenase subunit B [Candidatus Binataceae bacterium]
MRMRLAMVLSIAILISSYATRALAHGEAADEPFLKDLTVAYYDVHITPTAVKVGEPVTITGSVKILESWPYTLDPPQTAYVTPVVPGPCFALIERIVNGESSPGSIIVDKGGIYQFKMVMLARNPGHWHVHPGIAVQGTGTLLGPGEWVDVKPSGQPFKLDVTLLNGKTVDLEHFGGAFVWWWSFAGFIVGLIWMLYWTVPKRTVTRLAVTLQLPVNDDAPDIGLITARDHMWMDLLAGVIVLMLIVGWVYMAAKYPVRLPQQTVRFTPDTISPGAGLVAVHPKGSTFDEKTDTLVINFQVKNNSPSPISLKEYIMAMTTFVNGDKQEIAMAGPGEFMGHLTVEPDGPIAPGETKNLTLTMSNEIFLEERLIPLHDPQQAIAGLLRFKDEQGKEELVTLKSVLVPTEFKGQYLP